MRVAFFSKNLFKLFEKRTIARFTKLPVWKMCRWKYKLKERCWRKTVGFESSAKSWCSIIHSQLRRASTRCTGVVWRGTGGGVTCGDWGVWRGGRGTAGPMSSLQPMRSHISFYFTGLFAPSACAWSMSLILNRFWLRFENICPT